ncbi:leucyl/phenylalanyl-tRNA--protein transferase [Simiduia agarivorans]|uniref:Leucyl/phenylalanyl-tRNA--protein transferase n=1 Tax=Simiduia agarivorans (strain DSM 21679 / JCM 13881 / BCRC 17597 / SA1) TaxID=1117647 RepID=K4KIN5_SIMAS|nr:leucyl/phenylalanyl-tRNA--protein transferase [Simiduia agarivorans]AFU97833.1 leucyl/phenylalanyl-tRNA--protein transferase [Simiduia agarivorans SA1 = DSM 21679]
MIPWLEPGAPHFPPVSSALDEPNGLLAAGGELSPEWLIAAYQRGIFPWFDDESVILWWSPAPRMVLLPSAIHLSRSLRKLIRQRRFEIRFDTDFQQVIKHCSSARPETWILPSMIEAYVRLHRQGIAHSVEVWQDNQLVGGLYGVHLGGMFFGESMFSNVPNASKLALAALARHAQHWGLHAIDCQMHTEHLASMGATLRSRQEFNAMLKSCHLPLKPDWVYSEQLMDV